MPSVGIWLSGVAGPADPSVRAAAIRFVCTSQLQERILTPDGSFLLLLYCPGLQPILLMIFFLHDCQYLTLAFEKSLPHSSLLLSTQFMGRTLRLRVNPGHVAEDQLCAPFGWLLMHCVSTDFSCKVLFRLHFWSNLIAGVSCRSLPQKKQ